jgi:transcriptional regulator with XRE-family HTH domain
VKTFRERLGLSLEQLAVNAGLDQGLVGAIESGEADPAISVLLKLSRALGQRLGTFLDDKALEDPLVSRADGRTEGKSPHSGRAGGAYRYFSLGKGKADRHMEPLYVELPAGEKAVQSSHEGEEFIVVKSGQASLSYGKKLILLSEGDTAYYNSIVPHSLVAAGGGPATVWAVIFQPF